MCVQKYLKIILLKNQVNRWSCHSNPCIPVIHYKLNIISCLFYLMLRPKNLLTIMFYGTSNRSLSIIFCSKLWYFQNYLLTSIFYSKWLSSSLLTILCKKSFKSDFQQFNQKYKKNEQLPLTANNWTHADRNSDDDLVQAQNMAELNWLMGSQPFLIFTDSLPIKNQKLHTLKWNTT